MKVGHRGELDGRTAFSILSRLRELPDGSRVTCTIEWAQPMPKQGIVSAFNYGMGFGVWIGLLNALSIPFTKVRPQAWKHDVLAGYAKPDKSVSIAVARQRWPDADLGKRKDAGRAEALLIAEFGRRRGL